MWQSRYSGWKSVRPFYDERGNGIAEDTWSCSHKTPEMSSAQHSSNTHQLSRGCFARWWNIIAGNNSWLKTFQAIWAHGWRTEVLILQMCAILSAIYRPVFFSDWPSLVSASSLQSHWGFVCEKVGRKEVFRALIDRSGLLVVHCYCVIKHEGGLLVKDLWATSSVHHIFTV